MKSVFYGFVWAAFFVVSVSGEEKVENKRIALDSEFPAEEGATYFAGEATLIEHVNRKGILRLDRDGTINKYHWDLPHQFQLLPYGSVYFHGAAAELKHIPVGTHLHGRFYLGPEGEFEVDAPVSGYASGNMSHPDLRSVESQFSRAQLLEDDFSFYQRQGAGWKIKSISEKIDEVIVERVSLATGDPDAAKGDFVGLTGEQTFRLEEGTRYWKGNGFGAVDDLAVGQVVQLNLAWITLLGTQKQDGLCRDVWIDEASRIAATERQRRISRAHWKKRGVGALVTKTENIPDEGSRGYVTVQLFSGFDPALVEETTQAKSLFLQSAEPSLRVYDSDDHKHGHELEIETMENPPPGSSGVRIRMHVYEMLEGYRAGRTIRVGCKDWESLELPREEKLWPNDLRAFEVGPKYVSERDGPPPRAEKAKPEE